MKPLPPGQFASKQFPRFGWATFADRFPRTPQHLRLKVKGDVLDTIVLDETAFAGLPRVMQVSDFHCVTTWTVQNLKWSGYRFRDVYRELLAPLVKADTTIKIGVFRGQDGYRNFMDLEDLLAGDVLLADQLNGEPLDIAHGAPMRLVAPAHYGYKNVKHLHQLELWTSAARYKSQGPKLAQHPRARVALEERSISLPNWVFKLMFKPLIRPNAWLFARSLRQYEQRQQDETND